MMERAAIISAVQACVASAGDDEAVLQDVVALLQETQPAWNWVGIYLLVGETLVLGPYVGLPTYHTRIPVGVGVCGSAVAEETNIVIDDVRARENYLACSIGTRAEIVVLIRDAQDIVGQFDIDSDTVAAFGPADEALLESLAPLVGPRCRAIVERQDATVVR
jgi:L-methionine (R)-S-oxide reductase